MCIVLTVQFYFSIKLFHTHRYQRQSLLLLLLFLQIMLCMCYTSVRIGVTFVFPVKKIGVKIFVSMCVYVYNNPILD